MILLAGSLLLSACSAPGTLRSTGYEDFEAADLRILAIRADSVLADSVFVGANWSVKVIDLTTGRTLLARNDEANLLPASNAKMFTTAAALDQLGTDYTYETALLTRGTVGGDTLHGDLIVRGSGDPTFSGEFHHGNSLYPLQAWADTLSRLGIGVVDGHVIGDDDLFDDQALGYGWQWDDEPYYYAAQVSALSINDNCVDFTVRPTETGSPAAVSWQPDSTDYVTVLNNTLTVSEIDEGDEEYFRPRASNRIEILSRVPAGRQQTECLSIENPTLFFVHLLSEVLSAHDIQVTGRPVDIDELVEKPVASEDDVILARYRSAPLSDIAAAINKPSNNLYAELLLRTLGVERPVADTTITRGSAWAGAEAAARTFGAASIDTTRIRLADGSGLSRMHLVTTSMTASLLSYMWNHPDAAVREAFVASLPVGGVDGTLENRYSDGPARGNVRAKTGTMTSVSSLGGYVRTRSGRPLAFAMMCNNYTSPTSAVRAAQDRIVTRLALLP